MKRAALHLLLLTLAFLLSVAAYGVWTGLNPERYNWFDFLRGKPLPTSTPEGAPADPAGSFPAPAPAAAAGLPGSNTGLLAQTGPATESAPSPPRAVPVAGPDPVRPDPDSVALLEQVNRAMADLTDAVVPAVVSIDTSTTVNVRRYVPVDPFGLFGYQSLDQQARQPGLGSGVFVSADGYVLTNHHVIADVDEIQITTHAGESFEAEWVGSDPGVDIAVLKLKGADGRSFPHLAFSNSDQARVGEMVLAVGNPFGLTETVTRGIISAKQRRLSDGANEYFQTDTVINPGNSGGPLVNVRGEIVGINVALFTGQQEVRVWQGIGLAVPSNEASAVYEAIAHGKPLLRGYLGIELSDITVSFARSIGLRRFGAVVVDIAEGSPAAAAGLKAGDVIVSFDGDEVDSAESVIRRLRRKKAGTPVPMELFRQGQTVEITATVDEQPDDKALELKGDAAASGQTLTRNLGLTLGDLTAAERAALGLEDTPAIIIRKVAANSQGARRFRGGDLIHGLNRVPITSTEQFYEVLGELPANRNAILLLSRNGQLFQVNLQVGQR